ncbi:unnamed protein product [Rhizophagus irregularis]|nr:unnamed protein product [Rhizophagus irregularis]
MESSMTKTLDMTEIFSCWIRGNWNLSSNSELDGCFWIIGRVGLQTLKYGNEFELQGNSYVSNCCYKDNIGKDKDSWKTVKQYFT